MLDGPACGFVDLAAAVSPSWPLPAVGDFVWRAVGEDGQPLLGVSATRPGDGDAADPEAHTWLDCPHNTSTDSPAEPPLLHCLATCRALLDGRVTAVYPLEGLVTVRTRVLLPLAPSRGSDAAADARARVLSHLTCDWPHFASSTPAPLPTHMPSCRVLGCALGCDAAGGSRVPASQVLLADLLADLRPPRCDASSLCVPKLHAGLPNLGDLPAAALDAVLCSLDSSSFRAVASTCKALRQWCATLSPGLHLQLHPHQRDALAWMRRRELPPGDVPHPLWRPLLCDGVGEPQNTVWGHLLTGELATSPPERLPDCRGGMLCDEPGLGKTITVIALVLATKDTFAAPPANALACGPVGHTKGWWYIPPPGSSTLEEEQSTPTARPPPEPQLQQSPPPSASGSAGRGRRATAEHLSRLGGFAALQNGRGGTSSPAKGWPGVSPLKSGRQLFASQTPPEVTFPEEHPAAVFCSCTTLVACPPAVLAHWQLQLRPLILAGRLSVAVLDSTSHVDHGSPGACTWLKSSALPPPSCVASAFDLILMPLTLLSNIHASRDMDQAQHPLLRIRWLRIVLDEGHSLGASLGHTSRTAVAQQLRAERRWVVTGTPTPAAVAKQNGQLAHLQPLLSFLRVRGLADSMRDWCAAVQRPLEQGAACGRERLAAAQRLGHLARRLVVRSRKEDIRLKPFKMVHTVLQFTAMHAQQYNELVSHLRRSLLLADWVDPSHEQSLLNPRHAAWARNAVDNLRQAACVTGHTVFMTQEDEICKAMEMLRAHLLPRLGDTPALSHRLATCRTAWQLARGACEACGRAVAAPLVTPCGHVVCVHCIRNRAQPAPGHTAPEYEVAPTQCVVCSAPFHMQPPTPRADNPTPRQAVPQELIELQPSLQQSGWEVNPAEEAQGCSSKVTHLLARLRAIGAAPVEAPSDREMAAALAAAVFPWPQPSAVREARRAAQQRLAGGPGDDDDFPAAPPLPPVFPPLRPGEAVPKAIVYSSFATHLHVLDLALTDAKVPFATLARQGYDRRDKEAALASFMGDPLTRVVLLDRQGAEGLDLSCASHVFLCEPVPDRSLEQQVVSRAHRMGQQGVVTVEVLAMQDTAEATLLNLSLARAGHTEPAVVVDAADDERTAAAAEALSGRAILTSLRFARCQGGDDAAASDAPSPSPARVQALAPQTTPEQGDRGVGGEKDDDDAAWAGGGMDDETHPLIGSRLVVDSGGDAPSQPAPAAGHSDAPPSAAAPPAHAAGTEQAAVPGERRERRVMFAADHRETGAAAWTLRLRGPQLSTAGGELELPQGETTTVAELRARAARSVGLEPTTLRIRGGYPPRELPPHGDPGAAATTVAQAGLHDRDVVHIEGVLPDHSRAPAPLASASAPQPKKRQAAGGRRFPGKARKLGVGQVPGGGPHAALDAAALEAAGPVATAMAGAGLAPDVGWLTAGGGPGDVAAIAAGVIAAARGGGGGSDAGLRELRSDLARQVEARRAEQLGAVRVAAALAGRVEFGAMPDGRVHVTYAVPGPRGASATSASDVFVDVPPLLLPMVLLMVASDTDDPVSRANLQPERMAVASPRVFWSLVRHTSVGPGKSFAAALTELVPQLDWATLTTRQRQRPERYRPVDV
jgi:hypothetical protein